MGGYVAQSRSQEYNNDTIVACPWYVDGSVFEHDPVDVCQSALILIQEREVFLGRPFGPVVLRDAPQINLVSFARNDWAWILTTLLPGTFKD